MIGVDIMDALVVILALIAVYYKSTIEIHKIEKNVMPEEGVELKSKLNPDFHRDDKAFTKLYNAIVAKGTP